MAVVGGGNDDDDVIADADAAPCSHLVDSASNK